MSPPPPFSHSPSPEVSSQAPILRAPTSRGIVARPRGAHQLAAPREYQIAQLVRRYAARESSAQRPGVDVDRGAVGSGDTATFRTNTTTAAAAMTTTLLAFKLRPSDPDFPFDLTTVECRLYVPVGYAGDANRNEDAHGGGGDDGVASAATPTTAPVLRVANQDLPRGFAVNIEKGFDDLVTRMGSQATLLELFKGLDRDLENLLAKEEMSSETRRADLLEKDDRHLRFPMRRLGDRASTSEARAEADRGASEQSTNDVKHTTKTDPPRPKRAEPFFTAEDMRQAAQRRDLETRQLEARMGRLPLYAKSNDGIAYTIPIEPRKRDELPECLRLVKTFQLFVPVLYPLQACRIRLDGVDRTDAVVVEEAFQRRGREQSESMLMRRINDLTQNMHVLAREEVLEQEVANVEEEVSTKTAMSVSILSSGHVHHESADSLPSERLPERSMPPERPPEWGMHDQNEEDAVTDDESMDMEDSCEEEMATEESSTQSKTSNPERGTAISFPGLELHGIELLELIELNIMVKCIRCKDHGEIRGLRTGISHTMACLKCSSVHGITFRRELMHTGSSRAGFIDVEGCTVVDMLASTFIPTCSSCSTAYPSPGLTTIIATPTTNICHVCHQHMTLTLPSLKLLQITSASVSQQACKALRGGGRRGEAAALGIHAGTELPRQGLCKHYAKSYRWFRFSCCARVFPCDRCHDEVFASTKSIVQWVGTQQQESQAIAGPPPPPLSSALISSSSATSTPTAITTSRAHDPSSSSHSSTTLAPHAHEWATRMICGWCSREQVYRPEECGVCGRALVGSRRGARAFWEGGRGTRDRVRMSRKDPRKYRRKVGG